MVSTLSLSSMINQIFYMLLSKFPIGKFATLFLGKKHTEINLELLPSWQNVRKYLCLQMLTSGVD